MIKCVFGSDVDECSVASLLSVAVYLPLKLLVAHDNSAAGSEHAADAMSN